MYEEDRQTALAMYSKMFDDAPEEQSLLQFLVSPTRQAVVLARAYDSKERKLQVHSQSREDEDYYYEQDGQYPPFILAIDELQQSAAAQGIFAPAEGSAPVDENQFSLFDSFSAPAADETVDYAQPAYQLPAEPEQAAEAPDAAVPHSYDDEPDYGNNSVTEFADAVDAFLADFAISDGTLIPKAPEEEEDEPEPAFTLPVPEQLQQPLSEGVAAAEAPEAPLSLAEEAEDDAEYYEPLMERRANVPLLILYIILAVPLGLLGVAALLIPTLLCLSLALGFVSSGVLVLTAAFGGFAIFADFMIILGLSLVLLAFGLLMTWLFIWFIGGAIVGLIRGICRLGGNWCYKEVAAR